MPAGKKTYLLLTAIIFVVNTCYAQNDWLLYKIDSHLMVKLPQDPRKVTGNTFIAVTKDSTACIVARIDFKETAGLDSAGVAPLLETTAFTDSIKAGMVEKMKDFKLGEMERGKLNGHYTYRIDGVNLSQKIKLYTYLIVAGQYLYSVSALVKDGRSMKCRDDFFSSIIIN